MELTENIVKRRLESEGWTVYHSGFPDFLCVKDGRLKFVEVKSKESKPTAVQRAVIGALESCSIVTEIVHEATAHELSHEVTPRKLIPISKKKRIITIAWQPDILKLVDEKRGDVGRSKFVDGMLRVALGVPPNT